MISPKRITKDFFSNLLDFVSPHECLVCNELISDNSSHEFICNKCFDNIPYAPSSDEITLSIQNNYADNEFFIDKLVSFFSLNEQSGFMSLIYHLKYFGKPRIGQELGRELAKSIQYYKEIDFDMIIPVPIHHARMRERGFNQSESIAIGIGRELGIPTNMTLLKRSRYTQTQTQFSKNERESNVNKAFLISRNKESQIMGKRFLIVDDVFTTGATINACAKELKKAGATRVTAATLALA